jgi:prepilin-type N-terminal cleavage/methylation domain-containing protein
MLYSKSRSAFTLLEILVAVGILAILATVSFVSYTSFLNSTRDSTRLQDITKIYTSLGELKSKQGILPRPDNTLVITNTGGAPIAYQGFIGTGILADISMSR